MGPEMVLFVTELAAGFYSLAFIQENGCERFYQYNKKYVEGFHKRKIITGNRIANCWYLKNQSKHGG